MVKINEEEYKKEFGIISSDKSKTEKALQHALDIRKFEIELYWKRAAYFWTLIAAAFAGYFAILGSTKLKDNEYLAFIVGCIGLLFTWAWFLVNRGSKFWQENWENHVDMLEDTVTGPLYKTVLQRPNDSDLFENFITGPLSISVSKVNQLVSLFTLCIWIVLICITLPEMNLSFPPSIKHWIVAFITILFGVLMIWKGKTYKGPYAHIATKRNTEIQHLAVNQTQGISNGE